MLGVLAPLNLCLIFKAQAMPVYIEKKNEATVISEEYPDAGYLVMPKVIAKRADLTLAEKMIYALIFSFTGNNQDCFVSNGYIERQLDIKQKTIQTSLQHLEKLGLIEREIANRNERKMRVICNNSCTPSVKITVPPQQKLHTYTQVYTQVDTQVYNKQKSPLKIDYKEFLLELNQSNEFSNRGITATILENTYNKIRDYEKSKGKKYKDYKATIKNWLRKEIESGKYKKIIPTSNRENIDVGESMFLNMLHEKYQKDPATVTVGQVEFLKKHKKI